MTDYEPQQEQLSFILPTESEQIQIIDSMEAESIGMMPFASLVSQEVVDEFLRVGGNSDDLRLVIGTAIMKQLSTESVADYMCRSFHGGNGLMVDGRQYSTWYDEAGIHLAPRKIRPKREHGANLIMGGCRQTGWQTHGVRAIHEHDGACRRSCA